jgi:hypothetical protein
LARPLDAFVGRSRYAAGFRARLKHTLCCA